MNRTGRKTAQRIAVTLLAGLAIFAGAALQPARATDVCGAVCGETWTAAGSPYVATCDVTVADGCLLTIDGGVEVRFEAGTGLVVTGGLAVVGTPTLPVSFTSNESPAVPGDWRGLEFVGSSLGDLDYAGISQATYGIRVDDEASLDLHEVDAFLNWTALYIEGNGPPSVQATDCQFRSNVEYGVHVVAEAPGLDLSVTGSAIYGNGGDYQLKTEDLYPFESSGEVLHARGNWWGTDNSSAIARSIRDARVCGSGCPQVDWCGYLIASGGAARDVHCPALQVRAGETFVMDLTDKPWLLTSELDVEAGGTLHIGPGVEILSPANYEGRSLIYAQGVVEIAGTPASPALFTTENAADDFPWWTGLILYGSQAAATIENALFENGYYGIWAAQGAQVTADGVTAQSNSFGLMVNSGASLSATNCTIVDNVLDGLFVGDGSAARVSLTDSSVHSNGGDYDVRVTDTTNFASDRVIDATGNWWGTTDPLAIAARIWDRSEEPATARVDWCEYLDDAPPLGTARSMICPDPLVCDRTDVWDRTDKPYVLVSDVTVCPTGTLQIAAGVEVRVTPADPGLTLIVQGALETNGTGLSPVEFVSDAASPLAGDWAGIALRGGSSSAVDHAVIRHAERAVHVFDMASAALNGVVLQDNTDGLFVYGSIEATATGCTFTNNERYGVYAQGAPTLADPTVLISGSEIHSNGPSYDFYLDGGFSAPESTILDATGNWWGTTNHALIAARIRDRADSTTNALVDWCPYLLTAGGSAAPYNCLDLNVCDETEVLNLTDEPYLVTSDLTICPTGTLIVGPGVELQMVKVVPILDFVVEGVLDVNGTEGAPVLFTSAADTPAAGDWSGLRFTGVLPSELDHATVEYAVDGVYTDDDNVIDLTGVRLERNVDGFEARSTAGRPVMTAQGCTFTQNTRYGVYLYKSIYYGHPLVTINRSEIHSNDAARDYYTDGFSNAYKIVLDARENWWGSADPYVFGPTIADHRGNNGWPLIDWCRYLDGPGGDPVIDAHCPDLGVCDETVKLDLTDKPYQVTADLYVCATGTLEIGPGVTVLVAATDPLSDIQVVGALDVNGTEVEPVTFDSDAPDPQPQDWTGLYLSSSSSSTIDWAEVYHAVDGINVYDYATATLHGVTARYNRDGWVVGGYGPPSGSATDCTFTDNTRYGVRGWYYTGRPNPTLTVNGSSIHTNGPDRDFYFTSAANAAETVIDARGNWWGTTDTAAIGPRIYDHRTIGSSPIVDWCGYLDGEGGDPARDVHCPDLAVCDETVILDRTDRPYLLTSDLIVCDTGVLQIEPGVEVRMVKTTNEADFTVQGALQVLGTEAAPVLLTTDAEPPSVGDWYGVFLEGASVSAIEGAEIHWADAGITVTENATALLRDVELSHNYDGLWVQGYGLQTVTAADSSFIDNDRYGIFTRRILGYPNPDVTITRSSLHSNLASWDLYTDDYANPASSIVWATDNWWGTEDEAAIEARIRDYSEDTSAPRVYYQAFGEQCDMALGRDLDDDGWPDFDDNCPGIRNALQQDADSDGMGDLCDPEPSAAPSGACDGFEDALDGHADADGDGWGDPCDFHPLRADSYPGASELCDGRDNDGDGLLDESERADQDLDLGLLCGDCDDLEPLAHVCLCEECGNMIDDDCDLLADGADPDCVVYPTCIVLEAGGDPWLSMHKGDCGGAAVSGPFDVIRGRLDQLQLDSGHVDLGQVECVSGNLAWDRVTDLSLNLNPRCEPVPVRFYLGKETTAWDYGAASSGEPRDLIDPDPACP